MEFEKLVFFIENYHKWALLDLDHSLWWVILNLKYLIVYITSYVVTLQLFYAFGWFAAFGLAFAVVYGPYTATMHTWSEAENIIYGMTFRLVWAVALCWVIYACHNGYGSKMGFYRRVLSKMVWSNLNRPLLNLIEIIDYDSLEFFVRAPLICLHFKIKLLKNYLLINYKLTRKLYSNKADICFLLVFPLAWPLFCRF